jgi:hypothetical protein
MLTDEGLTQFKKVQTGFKGVQELLKSGAWLR